MVQKQGLPGKTSTMYAQSWRIFLTVRQGDVLLHALFPRETAQWSDGPGAFPVDKLL